MMENKKEGKKKRKKKEERKTDQEDSTTRNACLVFARELCESFAARRKRERGGDSPGNHR